ncbi:MAG TPA: glycosyltransferase family 2 protein [Solirubrobacteraceae bacterium]|nr:glycosyltransferase family 2 protein [Solirubrobacteraceae bacterium]
MSVAIPVRDGGELFAELLRVLSSQTVAHELVVCDSGSRDRSSRLAESHGARVLQIAPQRFSHGETRNLLMRETNGAHVALLTQDATPADERWLERLLEGFALAPDVALVYGPYRPRPQAALAVRLELDGWFGSLSPDCSPQVERLDARERGALASAELRGRRGFFTDANACVARAAWERVPFREVPYAEDRVLAIDMLRAGYAKAFVPHAAVIHSHAYSPIEQLRRSFDEWRGLREVYGWREPASPRHLMSRVRGALGQARGVLKDEGLSPARRGAALARVGAHQVASLCGALLGSRCGRMPAFVRRALSLERRAGFAPLALDGPAEMTATGPRIGDPPSGEASRA